MCARAIGLGYLSICVHCEGKVDRRHVSRTRNERNALPLRCDLQLVRTCGDCSQHSTSNDALEIRGRLLPVVDDARVAIHASSFGSTTQSIAGCVQQHCRAHGRHSCRDDHHNYYQTRLQI